MQTALEQERVEVDLVIFEIAGRRYGADASEVVRISAASEETQPSKVLGRPAEGKRALVVLSSAGFHEVPIDRVVAMCRVPQQSLRQLPVFARGLVAKSAVGFLVQEDGLLLLVDLEALVREEDGG